MVVAAQCSQCLRQGHSSRPNIHPPLAIAAGRRHGKGSALPPSTLDSKADLQSGDLCKRRALSLWRSALLPSASWLVRQTAGPCRGVLSLYRDQLSCPSLSFCCWMSPQLHPTVRQHRWWWHSLSSRSLEQRPRGASSCSCCHCPGASTARCTHKCIQQ